MTDLEFATCNLEKYLEIYNNKPKKFSELTPNEPIFCVEIEIREIPGIVNSYEKLNKYQLTFKGLKIAYPMIPRARKAMIYTGNNTGFIADKNVSSFIWEKIQDKGVFKLVVVATTLEECVFKAEKTSKIPNLGKRLIWKNSTYDTGYAFSPL